MKECQNDKEKKQAKFSWQGKLGSVCTFVVFLLLGALFLLQVRSVDYKKNEIDKSNQERIIEYEQAIEETKKKIDEQKKIQELLEKRYNTEMEYLYTNEKQFYELYKKYESEIELYEFYSGLTTVSGAGIDIGIDDAQTIYESTPGFLVHDIYLNEIINILRAAGAEAIAINGERIVSMSETLCLGPNIRVNNTRLFAPYHIEAIGDPQILLNAFSGSDIYETMRKDNLIVDPVIKENIIISKYSKSYNTSIDLLAIINEENPK